METKPGLIITPNLLPVFQPTDSEASSGLSFVNGPEDLCERRVVDGAILKHPYSTDAGLMVGNNGWHRTGVIRMIVSEHDGSDTSGRSSLGEPVDNWTPSPADINQDEASVRQRDYRAIGLADIPKIYGQVGLSTHAAERMVSRSIDIALLPSPSFT